MSDYTKENKMPQEEKYKEHKIRDGKLVESFVRLGIGYESKAARVYDCGTFLEFKIFEDGTSCLHGANFCKVRLCSMCSWRRSLKVFGQVSKIMDYVQEHHDYRFIFVTLTQRNVKGDMLSVEIDKIQEGFKTLTKTKEFKAISKGFFRAFEVTHNWMRNDYHPHIHMVIAVNKSYFNGKTYITHDRWIQLWAQCMGLDYMPNVDVRTVRAKPNEKGEEINVKKAIAEIAKYAVKSNDYIHADERKTDEAVQVLDLALKGRRLFGFGGKFREVHKKLNLDSPMDGDLADEMIRSDLTFVIVKYKWHEGISNYMQRKSD
jgi:plasmid rolling circle replication initiator protein Rep